jgi:AraC family transcriptional regulator
MSESTDNIYHKRIKCVLVYIEEHLDEKLSLECLAKIAHFSPFHFHRIFKSIIGESLYAYQKRLRIERAAYRLMHTKAKIIEIALDAGYESASAFTKAFRQFLGISPQEYRKEKASVVEEMLQQLNIKTKTKECSMKEPTIKTVEDIPVYFIRKVGPYAKGPNEAWEQMLFCIEKCKINRESLSYYGIAHDNPDITEEKHLRYDACICKSEEILGLEELSKQTIQGGRFAVFTHRGSYGQLEDAYDYIYGKWIHSTKEKLADYYGFLKLLSMKDKSAHEDNFITEIYIPLAN